MGGSLVKIVYFSSDSVCISDQHVFSSPLLGGGRLHFRKFESTNMAQCVNFIEQKQLHLGSGGRKAVVKATGCGAFKYVLVVIPSNSTCIFIDILVFIHRLNCVKSNNE